ncbi:carbohydrate ABC transporter permease [Lentibacillus saliphilus]|uniref:carbohydrate ABC transporter permease n=1 Tax=Lentibacillus saliphilus TaxID=2737028 RepID=UPI001C2F5ABE|nr:sugar ABC transporter permease [Lentibacillus saliphilus]
MSVAKHSKQHWKKSLFPWLLLAPSLLLLLFVVGGPIIGTIFLSFTDWDGIKAPSFVGLENFSRLIHDKTFYIALANNIKWMAIFLTIPVIMALIVALLISKIARGKLFYRTVTFIPYILSTVVTAKLWSLIYNPFSGVNTALEDWGLDFLAQSWIGDSAIALFSVAFADLWHFWGFLVVLFLMGMQQLDKSIEEAAVVEGAGRLRVFWHVTLPQLRPTLVLIYMLLIIWSFAAFDYVYIMTQGGPGKSTELLATYMYDLAIYNYQPGYASTVALTMGLFAGLVIIGFRFIQKKGWDV